MAHARLGAGLLALALVVTLSMDTRPAAAASAAEINRDVDAALTRLYADVPDARTLGERARAVLVFPGVVKAGFLFGAQYGDGALRRQGKTVGYYNTVAASYGLQAGVQEFGYALFFMSDSALGYLDRSDGFELGVGPSIVVVDAGKAKALTTTTAQNDIYAFIFDQRGLMAGAGLQGSKISRIDR
ncbi:MAG: twin-arginine translocation pathway signal protein [Candidatus Rokuibacteriota bacterium]|nr:MAG: twin-arginine translocation pathway signal protein [Candidatus Rokubacteria bacterium]